MQLESVRDPPNPGFNLQQSWPNVYSVDYSRIDSCDGVALALIYKEGVILAASRGEWNNYQTIYKLTNKICACVHGLIGDTQQIMKMAIAQIKLLEYNTEHEVPVRGVTHIIKNLLYSFKCKETACPINAEIIVAGLDCDGCCISHIFSDAFYYFKNDYCLIGDIDGLILLDTNYNGNLTEETALQLAENVMKMKNRESKINKRIIKRCVIDSNGVREIANEVTCQNADVNTPENFQLITDNFSRKFVIANEVKTPIVPFHLFQSTAEYRDFDLPCSSFAVAPKHEECIDVIMRPVEEERDSAALEDSSEICDDFLNFDDF